VIPVIDPARGWCKNDGKQAISLLKSPVAKRDLVDSIEYYVELTLTRLPYAVAVRCRDSAQTAARSP
jgi:hypothetical protein